MAEKSPDTPVSVMLIEHGSNFDTTESFVRAIFELIGYEVNVRRVDATKLVIDGKKSNPLFTEPFDVIVSDISWGGTIELAQGLSAIRYFRRTWPDLLVIGCSTSALAFPQVADKHPNFHIFAYKPLFTTKDYISAVASEVADKFRRNISLTCDFDSCDLAGAWSKPAERLELISLLKGLTFSGHSAGNNIARVTLRALSGGFSKAKVYRMDATTQSGAECVPSVVKISEPFGASQELRNYLAHVKWSLSFSWRPELLGSAFTASFGAVCYSFLDTSHRGFSPLNEYIAGQDLAVVSRVAKEIFDPKQQRWYHSRNILLHDGSKNTDSLTAYYRSRWFAEQTSVDKSNRQIRTYGEANDWGFARPDFIKVGGRSFRSAEIVLLGRVRYQYQSCIRHGDLHGGNVMVGREKGCSFIDFQDTGRGHVFEDFVVFESTLRLQSDFGMNWEGCFLAERRRLETKRGDGSDWDNLVDLIRSMARDNFPNEPWDNYIYSLGLFCLRLMRLDDLSNWQYKQILACLFACTEMLESA